MTSPEEKNKKRRRIQSHIAKDLRTPKYKKRVVQDKKKKLDVSKMTHRDLVKAIQEDKEFK